MYNLIVYYEIDSWGVCVFVVYWDEYLIQVEILSSDQDEVGFYGIMYWDFLVFYNINEKFKVSFEGINFSDECEE